MQNIHGPHEWVSVQDMARAAETCVTLVQLWNTSKDKPAAKEEDLDTRVSTEPDLVDWAG